MLIPELQELIETGEMPSTVGYKVWAKVPTKIIYGVNHGGYRKLKQDNLVLKKKQTNLADELNVFREDFNQYRLKVII